MKEHGGLVTSNRPGLLNRKPGRQRAGVSTMDRYDAFDQGPSGCPISLGGSAPGLGTYLSIQGPPN
jgi:hypothetical protein